MKWKSLKKLGLRTILPAVFLLSPSPAKGDTSNHDHIQNIKTNHVILPQNSKYKTVVSIQQIYEKRCQNLCTKMLPIIQRFECIDQKPVSYPYLDTNGLIHIGYGSNIDSWERFKQIDFIKNPKTGQLLTEAEKKAYFNQIQKSKPQFRTSKNGPKPFNVSATRYQKYFKFLATSTSMHQLYQKDMYKCVKELEKTLFQQNILMMNMPEPQILALLDIYYNTGNLNPKGWPKLFKALKTKDYQTAAKESHRAAVSAERNNWTAHCILEAAQHPESNLGTIMVQFKIPPYQKNSTLLTQAKDYRSPLS